MTRTLRRGGRLGKYRLVRRLGSGAFAEVWKARDTIEKRDVALKIALPDVVAAAGREELEHEARVAVGLHHPNIVAVRNADWIDGRFVMATQLAARSLAQYPGARRSGKIALGVIRDVAAGLAYAHGKRVMHRDLKPENIMIFADGRAALADFGASRLAKAATATYTEAGTLGYMAPEQAYGRPKLASDVFSLGVIAYELLTGFTLAWPFDWPPERYERFTAKMPEPLRPVLRRAADFEPERRWPDGVVFRRALERAVAQAERESSRRSAPRRRRSPAPAASPLAVEAEAFRRRHGSALGMRYRCFRCDGPIAEEMRACPWCGTEENSFSEITRYPLVCPECERGVRAEWTACPWCFKGRLAGNGRAPRPDPLAERSCSRRGCPGELRPFMRYCPICKQKVRRVWSHEHLPDRCPRCRGPVSRDHWRYCPWCVRRESRAGTFGR